MEVSQRWRERKDSYRKRGEAFIKVSYGVDVIPDDKTAKDFVIQHHYSGSYPAARCRVGLYRQRKFFPAELVGVAVFSVSARGSVEKRAGVPSVEGVDLGRFVLLDDVPFNGETWFLRRAFKCLLREKSDIRAVLAYSDPLPRSTIEGKMIMPGHVGTIYQAFNGRYVGKTNQEWMWIDPFGKTIPRRALSKIRNGECGSNGAYERLILSGADKIKKGENSKAYVDRVLEDGPFSRVKHPGNLAYVWAIQYKNETLGGFPPPLPYEKKVHKPPRGL